VELAFRRRDAHGVIVSGKPYVAAAQRETFLARSLEAVVAARRAPGCVDFVVAADPGSLADRLL